MPVQFYSSNRFIQPDRLKSGFRKVNVITEEAKFFGGLS